MPALNFRTIKIARPDGTQTVTLSAQTLSAPDPYPEINATVNNKSYQMRPKSTRTWKTSLEVFWYGY